MSDLEPKMVKCACGQKYIIYSEFIGDQRKCPKCRQIKESNHWGTGPKRNNNKKVTNDSI